jgi:hypothetical protein
MRVFARSGDLTKLILSANGNLITTFGIWIDQPQPRAAKYTSFSSDDCEMCGNVTWLKGGRGGRNKREEPYHQMFPEGVHHVLTCHVETSRSFDSINES